MDRNTHSNTHGRIHGITRKHTRRVCGVCTCERILSAGPSFSPMVLSRCSSVSSGNVSPSMACSRNTWRRHSRFSHSPDIYTHSTHKPTHSFTQPTKQWLYSKMLCTHFERKSDYFNIFILLLVAFLLSILAMKKSVYRDFNIRGGGQTKTVQHISQSCSVQKELLEFI